MFTNPILGFIYVNAYTYIYIYICIIWLRVCVCVYTFIINIYIYICIHTHGRRRLFCIDYWVPLRIPISMLGPLWHLIFTMYVHHTLWLYSPKPASRRGSKGVCVADYAEHVPPTGSSGLRAPHAEDEVSERTQHWNGDAKGYPITYAEYVPPTVGSLSSLSLSLSIYIYMYTCITKLFV